MASSSKKDDDGRLLILCCTANMGNAQPTASGLQAWIPKNGTTQTVTALDGTCRAKMTTVSGSGTSSFDIIMVGMQEATWRMKKKGKDGQEEEVAAAAADSAEEEDDEDYYNDETERSAAADFATPAAAAAAVASAAETTDAQGAGTAAGTGAAKRDEFKRTWSKSASSIKQMTTAEDSKYMRALLQENLGGSSNYKMIQEYQRGQMRLYLFVKQSLAHEITNLDGKVFFSFCCGLVLFVNSITSIYTS
jgi:hypothetical protein